jgi:hypothetical protein
MEFGNYVTIPNTPPIPYKDAKNHTDKYDLNIAGDTGHNIGKFLVKEGTSKPVDLKFVSEEGDSANLGGYRMSVTFEDSSGNTYSFNRWRLEDFSGRSSNQIFITKPDLILLSKAHKGGYRKSSKRAHKKRRRTHRK